jgi:Fanconi anemia group M protein
MYRELKEMKRTFVRAENVEKKLSDFSEKQNELVIYVDHREKASKAVRLLADEGFRIELTAMAVGDYVLAEDVCVEFKTVKDFVDSIIDGRLLSQAKALRVYRMPLIIIEGEDELYAQRSISPKAVQGMLATLALDFSIPVLRTKGPAETASLFSVIARKHQEGGRNKFSMHAGKPQTLKDVQEYIVGALPGVGGSLAPSLLEHFGSIRNTFNASEELLRGVDLIGEKKAKRIREVIDAEYENFGAGNK